MIRRDRKLLSAARDAHKHLQVLTATMDRSEVLRRMQDFLLHFGPPRLDGELIDTKGAAALNNAWVDSWTRHLRVLTPEALTLAVDRWMQIGKPFWPKPTELIKLGEAMALEQRKLAYRVKVACESVPVTKPPPSAEEKAQVREDLAEFTAHLAQRRAADPSPVAVARRPNQEAVNRLVADGLKPRPIAGGPS